jgi:hypothetical protein
MYKFHLPFSLLSACSTLLGIVIVAYIGLIAVAMSYATLTIEFAQSVREGEAEVAALESQYLAGVARITSTDYVAAGYAKPVNQVFVREKSRTALR